MEASRSYAGAEPGPRFRITLLCYYVIVVLWFVFIEVKDVLVLVLCVCVCIHVCLYKLVPTHVCGGLLFEDPPASVCGCVRICVRACVCFCSLSQALMTFLPHITC